MNLRCIYCQTPFTLSRAEMVASIQYMTEKNMNHYDASFIRPGTLAPQIKALIKTHRRASGTTRR